MESILRIFDFAGERGGRRLGYRLAFTLALWHHRSRSRRHLAALDDRELDDVGFTRAECWAESQKCFWQA
jgi:uncharacterized protein YjiS (DUF1127 family)